MSNELKDYLNNIDFLEAPLKGLLKHDMTDPEQLRKFVQDTRLMRESRQSFKAAVADGSMEAKSTIPRENIFADFEGDDK